MTRKEQIKILIDKIESNTNQYKVDRSNAEILAFSKKKKKDLKYKPNALDKARFEFSPLGKAFSTGLDKTVRGYQEEGVIKLLKDIRDGLRGGVIRPNNRPNNDNADDDDNNDDNNNNNEDNNDDNDDNKIEEEKKYADMLDLEAEEDAAKRTADSYEQKKDNYDYLDKINKFKNNMEAKMDNFDKKFSYKENDIYDKLNRLGNKAKKINNYIKEDNDKKVDMENKLNVAKDQYNNLLLEYNQLRNE